MTGFPITNTLMGLGAFPARTSSSSACSACTAPTKPIWRCIECDVMINIGARFDDRVTGRLDAFSPKSKKIHIDIDPSSINKNVRVDVPIVGDAAQALEEMIEVLEDASSPRPTSKALKAWWEEDRGWRARNCLAYKQGEQIIKPQYALERLYH